MRKTEYKIGPLNYQIKKEGRKFTLWLGGCRIGRPRADKPPDEAWEYHANSLTEAAREMQTDAQERLYRKIEITKTQLRELEYAKSKLTEHGYQPFRLEEEPA